MVDVPDVEGELLVPADGAASVDLRPTGDAGLHFHAARLEGVVARDVAHEQRTRADDAHVAEQDVPHLGELVERGRPEEAAERRETPFVGQQLAGGVPLVGHRPELHHAERLRAEAGPLLDEEHRRAELKAHEDRDHEQERREADEPAGREDDVERALEHQRAGAAGRSISCTVASWTKAPPRKATSYSRRVAQAGVTAGTTVWRG